MIEPEAYVPLCRVAFLPLGCRSGWELLAKLERYNFKIRGFDLLPEDEIIRQCTDFLDSPNYTKTIAANAETEKERIQRRDQDLHQWKIKKAIKRAWA